MRCSRTSNLFVGTGCGPEGGGPVLKELFQPAVEDRGVDLMLVAQGGKRNAVDRVPAQNRDFGVWCLRSSFMSPPPL